MKLATYEFDDPTFEPADEGELTPPADFIKVTDLIDVLEEIYHAPDIHYRTPEGVLSEIEMLAEGKEL